MTLSSSKRRHEHCWTLSVGPGDMFRLLGVQVTKLVDEGGVQGVLWEPLHREDEVVANEG